MTFFCLRHGRLLAVRCPRCGCRPPSRPLPSQAGRCCGPDGCGEPLGAASPPRCDGPRAARRTQEAIGVGLADLRDPAGTAASRRRALGQLTDITLVAYHLAADSGPRQRPGQAFTPGMLDAGTLTAAFTLLTAHPDSSGRDPLASLVTDVPPGTVPPAIPSSWHPASPALAARVARARDPWLRPADRLRHATTLPVPRVPEPRPSGAPDLAAARAVRLPDQLWPDWAVRLTDDPASSSHEKLLPAALIALLLPHSSMPLNQVTAMVSGQLRRHVAGYQLSKLTAGALRMLTELAFAIDDHGIPIDYRRRRDLAAGTMLIDDDDLGQDDPRGGDAAGPGRQRPPLPLRAADRLRPGHRPAVLTISAPDQRAATATSSSASPPAWPPRWPATPAACSTAGGSATSRCNGSRPMTG